MEVSCRSVLSSGRSERFASCGTSSKRTSEVLRSMLASDASRILPNTLRSPFPKVSITIVGWGQLREPYNFERIKGDYGGGWRSWDYGSQERRLGRSSLRYHPMGLGRDHTGRSSSFRLSLRGEGTIIFMETERKSFARVQETGT